MLNAIKKSGWLVGGLIFFMPVLLFFFLASLMAYGQVKGRFEAYQKIPEVTSLAELATVNPGQVVMVRGQISKTRPRLEKTAAADLVVFQERPANGREVRFREEFPLVFPDFVLDLPDGTLVILPSPSRERVIRHELHTVTTADREYTGFRVGDTVTIQGEWRPAAASPRPTLNEVTGMTGVDKSELVAEWRSALTIVAWVRNGTGLLTLLSILLLIIQLRRNRARPPSPEEDQTWQTQTTKTAPTA